MASFKCEYCGKYTHVDDDKYDGTKLCRRHINYTDLDFTQAKENVRQAVEILKKQGRFKDFEPQLQKIVKSKKAMTTMCTRPLTESLFDLELHYRKISHVHQYGMPFGFYRVDFCLDKIGAVIEIDGPYHNTKNQSSKDRMRDSFLENDYRIPVARVFDENIINDLKTSTDNALKIIKVKSKFLGVAPIFEKVRSGSRYWTIDRMGYYQ